MKRSLTDDERLGLYGCLVFLLTIPISLSIGALAIKCGWLWFITPLGVDALAFWQAMGLAALVRCVMPSPKVEDKKHTPTQQIWEGTFRALLLPSLSFGVMWLIHFAWRATA